jgi:hypothetical protein
MPRLGGTGRAGRDGSACPSDAAHDRTDPHAGPRRPGAPVAERDPNLEAWRDLRERAVELSVPHGAFYLLVVLSTTIAAYGLLANSTAVVIGAMLVAPLMGPIFGIAFGLTTGDGDLLGQAWRRSSRG